MQLDKRSILLNPTEWEDYAYRILETIEREEYSDPPQSYGDAMISNLHLDDSSGWNELFERESETLDEIRRKLNSSVVAIEPQPELVFRFLSLDVSQIRVIIIGMDPYYNGQACGLAFSVEQGQKLPASLKNIFTEIQSDLSYNPLPNPVHGDLSKWMERGVLLINASLTVEQGKSGSHAAIWRKFSNSLFSFLAERAPSAIVVCWGNHAREVGKKFNPANIISSPHPSPLSARTGFFGSRPFSRIDAMLKSRGEKPIDWRLW